MTTVKDFFDEVDAALGVVVFGQGGRQLYLDQYGNFTTDIFDAKDFVRDENAIEFVRELKNLGINSHVSVWVNAVDGHLIAYDMKLEDLKKDAEIFKAEQSKYDRNWIEWFKNPIC